MATGSFHDLPAHRKAFLLRFLAAVIVALVPAAYSADWRTDGGDSRRNNWQKDESLLTPANISGLRLLWKAACSTINNGKCTLFLEPLVIGGVTTPNGPRELVIEAGVSDNVYALDAKDGKQVWKRHFESTFQPPANSRGYRCALSWRDDGQRSSWPRRRCRKIPDLRRFLGRTSERP